jgi:hypothetical protein
MQGEGRVEIVIRVGEAFGIVVEDFGSLRAHLRA